jgi:pimeloyl-ACP methyl ester carboxylesterase
MAERGAMKELVADMAEKIYSDAYVKRYRPFMPLLTFLQKPKDVGRFVALAKACLTCNTYEALDKIKCPVLVLGGRQDKVVTGSASEEIAKKLGCKIHMYDRLGHAAYEEAKDFNQYVYDFLIG